MKLRPFAYAIPLLFLTLFFLYPLTTILRLGFAGDPALGSGGAGVRALLADTYYLEVLWFSTWQALLSTALTLAIGLPAAYVFARYDFAGKTVLRAIATVPFVMPTVVVAAAFKALLGPRDLLNTALQSLLGLTEPPIRLDQTLTLILLAHIFYNYSLVLRIVGGFWSTLDTRLEQAAAVLGAGRLRAFREITLPLLLPAIGAAALLIFIFTFSSFGVIRILGGPHFATVEVEIYRQTAELLRLDVAAALSLIQMAITLLMTLIYTQLQARASVPLDLRSRSANARRPRGWRERALVGANLATLLLLLGAPLLALALRSITSFASGRARLTPEYYRLLGTNPTGSFFYVPPLRAVANTLGFALAATLLALLVGVPGAYLLAHRTENQEPRTGRRNHRFSILGSRFSGLLDPLFMLPLGTSAATLGLGYIVAFGRPPLNLLTSPLLIPIAHALLAFPFVVRSLLPALRGLDPRLREAARSLGAEPARVLREIDLPLLFPALLVGAVFAFTVSIGEFGAALLLYRPEYPTVPVVIDRFLGLPGQQNYGQALALSTILMVITGLSFVLLEQVRFRDVGEF
ncbi:MAG TPA: iron ABC transporter permease [Roseiflexaceae bacterium]|nr:iron ABC transporter permease [Roseiflexaceae bacterium]